MRKKITSFMAILLLLAGLGVLFYPAVSNVINRYNSSYAIARMNQELEPDEAEKQLALAREYNENLKRADGETKGYDRILNFGNGLMGYICIDKIEVRLPIYHGTDAATLEKGVGHMHESAFPIGGNGNHAVLTGHTGLPSAKLFTDLTELEEGDRFSVVIAGATTVYQVDQIRVVLPSNGKDLQPAADKDYCTLVTCTPYGVNSHRLLVRGFRVGEEDQVTADQPESWQPDQRYSVLAVLCVMPTLIVLIMLALHRGKGSGYD